MGFGKRGKNPGLWLSPKRGRATIHNPFHDLRHCQSFLALLVSCRAGAWGMSCICSSKTLLPLSRATWDMRSIGVHPFYALRPFSPIACYLHLGPHLFLPEVPPRSTSLGCRHVALTISAARCVLLADPASQHRKLRRAAGPVECCVSCATAPPADLYNEK